MEFIKPNMPALLKEVLQNAKEWIISHSVANCRYKTVCKQQKQLMKNSKIHHFLESRDCSMFCHKLFVEHSREKNMVQLYMWMLSFVVPQSVCIKSQMKFVKISFHHVVLFF